MGTPPFFEERSSFINILIKPKS